MDVINYQFNIEGFSGPFHLLLELAKQHEIELTTISLDTLIDQYLDFIKQVEEQGLDIRSSYLEMAAELLRLKSLSLLSLNDDEVVEEEALLFDRDLMIKRILEYKKYHDSIVKLQALIDKRGYYLSKKSSNLAQYRDDNFKNNFDPQAFYKAVGTFLLKQQNKQVEKLITLKEINIAQYVNDLKTLKTSFYLHDIMHQYEKEIYIALFLAILEALKQNYISVSCENQYIIKISPKGDDE